MSTCFVCGKNEFTRHDILWDDLISKWQLSSAEVNYINRQQGECCRMPQIVPSNGNSIQ